VQQVSTPGYVGTRLGKAIGADGGIDAIHVRFMRSAGLSTSSFSGTIGYLAIGTPWAVTDGRVTLKGAGGADVDIQFSSRPNGTCCNLDDYDFEDLAETVEFAAHRGRAAVVLYDDPFCKGSSVGLTTRGSSSVSLASRGFAGRASSFRVMWSNEQRLTERGCVEPGTGVLENDLSYLIFQEDGDLVLYKRNPADDTLWAAWSANSVGASRLCFGEDGNLVADTTWSFSIFGTEYSETVTLWTSGTADQNVARMTLQDDCNLVMYNANSQALWSTGTYECWQGAPMQAANAMPELDLAFADLDGDTVREALLLVQNADGSGYALYDPFGIADTMRTLGYTIDDDFWEVLSDTQKSGLVNQLSDVADFGTTISGAELNSVLDAMVVTADRTYDAIRFSESFDGSLVEESASVGELKTTFTTGDYHFVCELDDYGPGFELEATLVQLETTYGGVIRTTLTAGSGGAAFNVDENGFTVGGGVDAVSLELGVGDPDGSYAALSVGIGLSVWADAKFGKNDQYGFSLDLPILKVGVALYVKGADAVFVYDECKDWTLGATNDIATLATFVWGEAGAWVQSAPADLRVDYENAVDDTRIFAEKTAGDVWVGITNTSDSVLVAVESATGNVAGVLDAVGDDIADGAEAVADSVTTWAATATGTVTDSVDDAVESVGDAAADAADDMVDAYEDAADWTKDTFCGFFGC
jgi:hypothetical protein